MRRVRSSSVDHPMRLFAEVRFRGSSARRGRRYPPGAHAGAVGAARRLHCDARSAVAPQNSLRSLLAASSTVRCLWTRKTTVSAKVRVGGWRRACAQPRSAGLAARARSALRELTRRSCLNGVSAAHAVSSAMGPAPTSGKPGRTTFTLLVLFPYQQASLAATLGAAAPRASAAHRHNH
jgi:hypothetical protein